MVKFSSRKLAGSWGGAPSRFPQKAKSFCLHRDQENRTKLPVDVSSVRNPIKGFLKRLAGQAFRKNAKAKMSQIQKISKNSAKRKINFQKYGTLKNDMQRKMQEIGPRKTRRKSEKFFKKGVAISYFACYNNTCVTATDMR